MATEAEQVAQEFEMFMRHEEHHIGRKWLMETCKQRAKKEDWIHRPIELGVIRIHKFTFRDRSCLYIDTDSYTVSSGE